MEQKMNGGMIDLFEKRLKEEEKSEATIRKYVSDVKHFMDYTKEDRPFSKELVIGYKQYLSEHYKKASVNSMLASVNSFLRMTGHPDCAVKTLKMQRAAFRGKNQELSREEYLRLLNTAKKKGKRRLFLLMQTIAATGIRISELPFITVEALKERRAQVSLKGKTRTVILQKQLCEELACYAEDMEIRAGSIFITRTGKPLDRSNVLHQMKALYEEAGVPKDKIYPHNFRHLFAVTYYNAERDICHLADLLGHSNINTTRIYTQVSCEEQEQQLDRLGLLV
ncbi:MAG TPA: integrase [Lachnospiraceae bacterium]|nr:integrase [Lachnospiraceae bacterium]